MKHWQRLCVGKVNSLSLLQDLQKPEGGSGEERHRGSLKEKLGGVTLNGADFNTLIKFCYYKLSHTCLTNEEGGREIFENQPSRVVCW